MPQKEIFEMDKQGIKKKILTHFYANNLYTPVSNHSRRVKHAIFFSFRHASYPPLCVQLCMSGIADVNPDLAKRKQWSANSREVWKMLLREDVPLKIVGEISS